jgi:hypothetical protein
MDEITFAVVVACWGSVADGLHRVVTRRTAS